MRYGIGISIASVQIILALVENALLLEDNNQLELEDGNILELE